MRPAISAGARLAARIRPGTRRTLNSSRAYFSSFTPSSKQSFATTSSPTSEKPNAGSGASKQDYEQGVETKDAQGIDEEWGHGGDEGAADLDRVIQESIDEASRVLPTQAILDKFVHQNPLATFENMDFNQAVAHVHELERYMSPAEQCFHLLHIDPRPRVDSAMADLCASFLDHGAARWSYAHRDLGFLHFFAAMEGLGFAAWRKNARQVAQGITAEFERPGMTATDVAATQRHRTLATKHLTAHLERVGVPKEKWTAVLRASMGEQRGWAGMFNVLEKAPSADEPSDCPAAVRLVDFLAVRAILTQASIDHISWGQGHPDPYLLLKGTSTQRSHQEARMQHVSALAYVDQQEHLREELEEEYKHTLMEAIGTRGIPSSGPADTRPKLQVWTCIDDRMESLRRHLEEQNPTNIETLGVAGFFGVPIKYQPIDGREVMTLAPLGVVPRHLLKEVPTATDEWALGTYKQRRRMIAQMALWWENASFLPVISVLSALLAPFSIARLLLMAYAPITMRKLKNAFHFAVIPEVRTTFELPLPSEEAAATIAKTLKDIGTKDRFAPLVLVLGHGSSSVNNPFHSAYQCGACQGRDGAPNARLVARIANDPDVRNLLATIHGIQIPDDTHFVGGGHNTSTDKCEFFDVDQVPRTHHIRFEQARRIVDRALGKNALERCSHFLLDPAATRKAALGAVANRALDPSEIRPELNHASNAGVIVGRRSLTTGRFLDRRAFLVSYDPFVDDARGTSLERVLTPALIVCSGINLEYLFSTTSEEHSAGTKVPLNVVANIGLINGTTGDLRTGLPSQMTEMHTPIRAQYIIDAPVARVEAVLARNAGLKNLVRNEWVQLVVRDPTTDTFFEHCRGHYTPIESATQETHISFSSQRSHGALVAQGENWAYYLSNVGMVLACVCPIAFHYALFSAGATHPVLAHYDIDISFDWDLLVANPRGAIIAVCATSLALPTLAFARRYLHGEFMFGRFSVLCVALLLGFNLVATAPTLLQALPGWTLFGFASAFLIGMYNERPKVRLNATYAFAAYTLADMALLVTVSCMATGTEGVQGAMEGVQGAVSQAFEVTDPESLHAVVSQPLVAAGLLLAAFFKSSQFPLTALFARSMEGPTPSSALGYAGLSAHIGVVLLALNMPLWFEQDWARMAVGGVGLVTAVFSTLVAHTRADRKGAVAYATSATVAQIFVVLAMGYSDTALVLSFGHAAYRMTQILRSPSIIADTKQIRAALGGPMPLRPSIPPVWLYRLAWRCRRIDMDLMDILRAPITMTDSLAMRKLGGQWDPLDLTRSQQWGVTATAVVLMGFPGTPVYNMFEHYFMESATSAPLLALCMGLSQFAVAVVLMRFLLSRVLNSRRFHRSLSEISRKRLQASPQHIRPKGQPKQERTPAE